MRAARPGRGPSAPAPARTRCAPARRSSSATIGRSTRSIAAYSALHDRVVLVQPAAIDLHHQLGSRAVSAARCSSSNASQLHLAVEMPSARMSLCAPQVSIRARPGRLAPRASQPSRARGSRRQRRRAARSTVRAADWRGHLDLVVEQDRAFRVRLGLGVAHDLDLRPIGQLKPHLTRGVLETRRELHELDDQRPQASVGGQALDWPAAPSRACRRAVRGPARRGHARMRTGHRRRVGRTTTRPPARRRTPWMRPAPWASHTSRRPRPKRPRCPSCSGSSPARRGAGRQPRRSRPRRRQRNAPRSARRATPGRAARASARASSRNAQIRRAEAHVDASALRDRLRRSRRRRW